MNKCIQRLEESKNLQMSSDKKEFISATYSHEQNIVDYETLVKDRRSQQEDIKVRTRMLRYVQVLKHKYRSQMDMRNQVPSMQIKKKSIKKAWKRQIYLKL